MKGLLLGLLALGTAFGAHAGCHENFAAIGDARNGMAFAASVTLPGLKAASALGQMQGIAAKEGFEVGMPDLKGNTGDLYFIQSKGLRLPLTFLVSAYPSGEVSMTVKLARGQTVAPEAAEKSMCDMLVQLKTGAAGDAAAAAAHAASGADKVTDVKAPEFSAQMGKEVRKAMSAAVQGPGLKDILLGTTPAQSKNDQQRAFAPLVAKYVGRKYRIDGQIYTISGNEIAYLVTQTRGLLAVRQSNDFNNINYTLVCKLPPSERLLLASLNEGDWVTLEGTVDEVGASGMRLRDCRQAKK